MGKRRYHFNEIPDEPVRSEPVTLEERRRISDIILSLRKKRIAADKRRAQRAAAKVKP